MADDALDTIIANGPGRVNFSPLGQLFQSYQQGVQARQQNQAMQARQTIGDAIGDPSNPDYGAAAVHLLQAGDVQGATAIASLSGQQQAQKLQLAQFNRPTFSPSVARDQYGQPIPGFVNPNTQTVTPVTAPGVSSAPATNYQGTPGTSGDDYLKSLDPQAASQVKALAEGRMAFPNGPALKAPFWQMRLQQVGQYDPNFDAVNYNARSRVRQDFTSGTSAKQVNALNTVAQHLEGLSDAATALNNGRFPMLNSAENAYLTATGDPRVNNFNLTRKAVADELTRVWRGAGGSEGDIKTWTDTLNSAGSPQQLNEAISHIGELIQGKVNALGEQYTRGMGTTASPLQLVTPAAQASFDKFQRRANGETVPNAAGAPAPTSAPGLGSQGAPVTAPALPKITTQAQVNDAISQARAAIAAGKDRGLVIQRLRQMGIEANP
jgi:hypothetical protein